MHEPSPHDPLEPRCEGRPFPAEAEWLSLPPPPIVGDFVERTMRALAADLPDPLDALPPSREQLAAYRAPAPSPIFVDATLRAIQRDRLARWRELLARHVAPEPSADFVARTLRALAAERGAAPAAATSRPKPAFRRTGPWPLLLAAAGILVALWLRTPLRPSLEHSLAEAAPAGFASSYAAGPLPALLARFDRDESPRALPDDGPDGVWLLLHRRER